MNKNLHPNITKFMPAKFQSYNLYINNIVCFYLVNIFNIPLCSLKHIET